MGSVMNKLHLKAIAGLLNLFFWMALAIFLPAWTLSYWQAWVFLAVFFAAVFAVTFYLMKNDPKLLERRVQPGPIAEKQKRQQLIQSLAALAFLGMFVVPGLDHRLGWSSVPLAIILLGDVLVALGLLIVFFVFRENTYTSAVIEVEEEQKIVTSGPYAVVRHPMYAGAMIMLIGVPLALASYWGLLTVIPIMLVIIWRLLGEEEYLAHSLAGYTEYIRTVHYRLIPRVW